MDPRAACRLEMPGFTAVYDYVHGSTGSPHGLPVEGDWDQATTAGALAHVEAADLSPRLADRDLASAVVTTPRGG